MKTTIGRKGLVLSSTISLTRVLAVAGFLFGAISVLAQMLPPGGGGGLTNAPLASWSFNDTNNWTDDASNAPVSFTNITGSWFGDGTSMTLASTNPAWLNYNIYEPAGGTNLTVDQGSFFLWFSPNWAGTNEGGNGPGQYGRLLEVGAYTSDASFGWWSLYTDPVGANLYFSVQPGDGSTTTYLTAPIDWASNSWHFVALTYCATNTAIYLDGVLATNGPGLGNWPGTNVLAGGFYLGSDSNGLNQASGSFDDLYTYNVPLDASAIADGYNMFWADYYLTPWNFTAAIVSAPSNPSTNSVTPDVITGAGDLLWDGSVTPHYSTNANVVWITNITATAAGGGTENVTFTIQGGEAGYFYDVFATGALESPLPNALWFWMGQGNSGNTYTLPITSANAFIILGTPQDSDGDGLTDAYELLVSHTDPHNAYSNLDGILDGWDILLGLNPQLNNANTSSERANYGYTLADWLNGVTGTKSGTITTDNEGNVTSVSQ
jgi:hypothetical protein